MSGPRRLLLYSFVALNLLLVSADKPYGSKERPSRKEKKTHSTLEHKTMPVENICQIQNPVSVYCYCNAMTPQEATDANCWIFNDTRATDSVWDAFYLQRELTELRVNLRPDGSLRFVPTRALRYLHKLVLVEVQYASIPSIGAYAFANLTSLEEIVFSRNQIVQLRPHAFAAMPNLTTLTLGENRIAELHRNVFVQLPSLRKLYIDRNNLSIVHDRAFVHLHALEELELFGNQLAVITKDTFAGLHKLRRLDLRQNRLEMLGEDTFTEMKNLEELDLMENSIKYVSERALMGLPNLMLLNLNDNKLTVLGRDVFSDLERLNYLDLRNNVLETITQPTFQPIMHNLRNISMSLYLEGNSFVCDCRLAWMHSLWNETHERVKSVLEQLTCFLDDDRRSKPQMDMPHGDTPETSDAIALPISEDYQDLTPKTMMVSAKKPEGPQTRSPQQHPGPGTVKHLFEIPVEQLPCPEKYSSSRETSQEDEQDKMAADADTKMEAEDKMAPQLVHLDHLNDGTFWNSGDGIKACYHVLFVSLLLLVRL